jgi:hypothetical protein
MVPALARYPTESNPAIVNRDAADAAKQLEDDATHVVYPRTAMHSLDHVTTEPNQRAATIGLSVLDAWLAAPLILLLSTMLSTAAPRSSADYTLVQETFDATGGFFASADYVSAGSMDSMGGDGAGPNDLVFEHGFAPLLESASSSQPIYVDTSGSDAAPGTQLAPKRTIQSGITAAVSSGADTVVVGAGVYSIALPVSVPAGVTLRPAAAGFLDDFGTLTLAATSANALELASGSAVEFDLGSNADRIQLGGAGLVVNGSTLRVAPGAGFGVGDYLLFANVGAVSGSGFTQIEGVPPEQFVAAVVQTNDWLLLRVGLAPNVWTNPAGGNWNVAANWSLGRIPTPDDIVVITNAGTYTVTLSESATMASLTLGGASGQQTLRVPNVGFALEFNLRNASTIHPNGRLTMGNNDHLYGGPLTVQGEMAATNCWIESNVVIAVASGGSVTFQDIQYRGVFTNRGTALFAGVGSQSGAAFYNETGGVMNMTATGFSANHALNGNGASPRIPFRNAGILRGPGGASHLSYVAFENTGTVESLAGTLGFTVGSSYTQSAGVTRLAGGSLRFDDRLQLNGGTLSGSGLIAGAVVNNGGTIQPGISPGRMDLDGNFTQGPGGTLEIELTGTTPDIEFDHLVFPVNRTVTLGGTLRVSLAESYSPAINTAFQFISGGFIYQDRFASFIYPSNRVGLELRYAQDATTIVVTNAGPPTGVPPSITAQPLSITVACGTSSATLSITATGAPPLSYQWRFNDEDIIGATDDSFAIANPTSADQGGYSVVITNSAGAVTSVVATLMVEDTTPPTLICSPPILAGTTNTNGLAITYHVTATDACDPAPALVSVPPSGSTFAFGTNTVASTASDTAGNSTNCSFEVVLLLCETTNFSVGGLEIPDGDVSGIADSRIVRSRIGQIADLNMTLAISGGWNGDLYAYLVHQSGFAVLLNRVGQSNARVLGYGDSGFNVTLDDQAEGDIHHYRVNLFGNPNQPLNGALTGTWQPDGRTNDPLEVAEAQARAAFLASFNGLNPDGEWTLFLADLASGDISALDGWGLQICGLPGAPEIVEQPLSTTLEVGQAAEIRVLADGVGPLSYQWFKDTALLPGETAAQLRFDPVVWSAAGNYQGVVSSPYGSTTSEVAVVTVSDTVAPDFTCPAAVTVECLAAVPAPDFAGGSVSDAGDPSPTVLWKDDVASGTCPTLITRTYLTYDASLNTNSCTQIITVEDTTAPTVAGGTIAACYPTIAAAEAAALAATTASDNCGAVTLTAVTAGTCSAVITVTAADLCGNSATAVFSTRIDNSPPALSCPPGIGAAADENCEAPIPDVLPDTGVSDDCGGAVTLSQTPAPGARVGLGSHAITVTGIDACGNTAECTINFTVSDQSPPVLTSQPLGALVTVGSAVSFSVAAADCTPLSYQWLFNHAPLANETNALLELADVQLANAGAYSVAVSSSGGAVTSSVAILVVNRPPIVSDLLASTRANTNMVVSLIKLLARAYDPDNDPLTISAVSPTSTNGSSVVLGPTAVIYTPSPGFIGTDAFSFTVSDGRGGTATGSVLVQVTADDRQTPNMTGIAVMAGGVRLRFAGLPHYTYRVQRAPTATGPWTTLGPATTASNGQGEFLDTDAPPDTAFYRTAWP